jgi:hypothetical protein
MKKPPSPRRRYGGALLVLLLICTLAAGCGKPRGIVSGKVTYQGKPLTAGSVLFTPEKGSVVDARIDGEGNYRAENVPVGTAKISVRADAGVNTEALRNMSNPRDPAEMAKAMMPQSRGPNLGNYGDPEKSGLTYDVKKGSQEYDIQLK